MEIQTIEFILRVMSALTLIPAVYELWKITNLISNKQFATIMQKIGLAIAFFILARILGANLDTYFKLEINVFGYLFNLIFWIWVAYYFHKQRVVLQSENLGTEGRRRVSKHIDDIINEIKQASEEKRINKK